MQLPDEAVEEFKKIWREEYGQELNDDEARKDAERFMRFFKLVFDSEDHSN